MRRLLVAVLLSLPLLAQSPDEWDVERRLAARFDEARNAERVAALVARFPNLAFKPEENAPGSRYYVIEGERNPELFLPHELFEGLLSGVDPIESSRDFPRDLYGKKLGDCQPLDRPQRPRHDLPLHRHHPGDRYQRGALFLERPARNALAGVPGHVFDRRGVVQLPPDF
jgi:hypothetical protein